MKKYILVIVLASLCLIFKARAQERIKLSGTVFNHFHQPLVGVTIKIKNSNIITTTNTNGTFNLISSIKQGVLQFSFLGYKTSEINFTGNTPNLMVSLEEDQNDLNEVVVIGYGQTTKKLNTGSVSSISAKEIEHQPVTNVLSALSGRMPGVFVQTTNGLPGGNINIQIRGKGSIGAGTTPLYIIDGVPYDGAAPLPVNDFTVVNNIAGASSPLNNLNPADIASVTVLKDADATAIYGSRGANGVILIQTKQAKAGDTKIEVNIEQGISKISNRPDLLKLKDYLALRREAFANDNLLPSSDPLSVNYAPDLTVWSQNQDTDWVDYLFGNTASSRDLQARIAGGKGNTTFSVNGNYRNEDTVLPGENNYTRGGLSFQLQHRSENNKLSVSISSQLTHQYNDLSNLTNSASYLLVPNYSLYLADGTFNWYAGTNPAAEIYARSKTNADNTITSLNLSYNILPELNIKIDGGHTSTTYNQQLIFPNRALAPGNINYAQYGNNSLQSIIFEPQVNYQLTFNKARLSFLAGATFQKRTNDLLQIQASNFKLESLMENLSSAGTIDYRSTNYTQYKYASLFGRLTYNLDDSYILNGTIRRDGSSRFGPGNRYGSFGAVGATWIFSNMGFVKNNLGFLSYGKLRASYGTTGNDQIGDYQYLSTYSSLGSNIYHDVATMQPSRISNDNFHWETTRKTDLALELGFLKNRITLSADYYISKSKDQLVYYNIPQITGFSSYQANLPAVIRNSGWELAAMADILKKQDLSWTSSFNITFPKNKLQSFKDFKNSGYDAEYELGYDITRIYGYQFLGNDPVTGKPQYAGENGEAAESPYFNFTLGKLTPDYYGGFSNTFNYKNIELNVFAQFVKQVTRGHGLYTYPGTGAINNYNIVKNRWSPDRRDASFPKASTIAYDVYYPSSSLNVFNTSYLRLKNVSVSYVLSEKLTENIKVKNIRIYLQGQNLWTLWDKGTAVLDPESGALSSGAARNLPPLKSFVFGLQLTL
ncbi:SusC/RagA family TonB-linked outer membrane protein [Pedobacter sp. B4-66]|uniref:SusC/RagA family TonB-linked outer membrane protein n=1 Tax=Pedobacter sp. B4-66 TaxID=2817280 RepID=UPI001BDAA24A|nr:SusC/RagA family TonB-linked outer membrane protein [Pedobacter sp. B4-66]